MLFLRLVLKVIFLLNVIYPQVSSIKDGKGTYKTVLLVFLFLFFLVWLEMCPYKGMRLACSLNSIGFLTGLLKHLIRHHACAVYRDADTQTSWTASYGESLGTHKGSFFYLLTCPLPHLCLIMSCSYRQLRRWRASIRNMRSSVIVGTICLQWNQNWLHIEKTLRQRDKQKWTKRSFPHQISRKALWQRTSNSAAHIKGALFILDAAF